MVHFCGYTYVQEGVPNEHHGYDGSPLMRCSLCKLQCYVNKDAQKAHWKLHKHSCKALASGNNTRIVEAWDTLEQCFEGLKSSLRNPRSGAELPAIIRKIRSLMDADVDNTGDMAFEIHTFCRSLVFSKENRMLPAMAKPGMVSLMLTSEEEDLLSEKNRFVKQNLLSHYNGRPTIEYVEGITNPDERKRVQNACDKFDELHMVWGQPSSMSFCYLYYNLLVAAAVEGQPSMTSINDGQGTIRGMADHKSADFMLATAAIRRALSLWSDPLVLDSTGDAMAPAAGLAHRAILNYNTEASFVLQKNEVAPGLTVDGAVCASLKELSQQAASGRYSEGVTHVIAALSRQSNRNHFWKDLPLVRRAKVALAIVHYVVNDERTYKSEYGPNNTADVKDLNVIFRTACGLANPSDEEVTLAVWTKAAEEGETMSPEGAGRNAEIRAFFYYLLRRWELECSQVYDLKQEIDKFESGAEKPECLERAYSLKRCAQSQALLNHLREEI